MTHFCKPWLVGPLAVNEFVVGDLQGGFGCWVMFSLVAHVPCLVLRLNTGTGWLDPFVSCLAIPALPSRGLLATLQGLSIGKFSGRLRDRGHAGGLVLMVVVAHGLRLCSA